MSTHHIPLTHGLFALIDERDADRVDDRRWYPMKCGKTTYAVDSSGNLLHVELLGPRKGKVIDHKNRIGLDCRRSNLRHVTHSQNIRNSRYVTNTSGLKGVSRCAKTGKWSAFISIENKNVRLGRFTSKAAASAAYREAACAA